MVLKCTKCKKVKPSSEFHKRKEKINGFTSNCKECRNKHSIGAARAWRLANIYNVTEEQIKQELEKNNGNCSLCNKPMKKSYIDHDHKNEIFRGVIHRNCNLLLGHANDDIELLQKAINYLKRFV